MYPGYCYAVVAPTAADYSFPSMGEICDSQDIYTDGKAILNSALESGVHGENGLYRVGYREMLVILVSPAERSPQVRLLVCAHMQVAGHRGICATMHQLGAYRVWEGMKVKGGARFRNGSTTSMRCSLHSTRSTGSGWAPLCFS